MLAEKTIESAPMKAESHKAAFFRQSGWMMIATVGGGAFMFVLHSVAQKMPTQEYGLFTTLLQVVTLMAIPAVGLQSVFAQQAAAALNETQERQLAGVLRGVLKATFTIWLIIAACFILMRQQIRAGIHVENPTALWITVVIGLAQLWYPIVMGMLQGRHNFLWLGWTAILNGVGRFTAVVVAVLLLGTWAAGAMAAVFVGLATAIVIGGWHIREYLSGPAARFEWREWLGRVIPLTLGLGAAQFMLCADMVFVRRFYPADSGAYAAAGMIGRALVYFTQPLTIVMFPRLVRSAATSEKTNVLGQVLGVTALLGGLAALGCTVMPRLALIIYAKKYLAIATPLVPWFAWCMVPLVLSNVLINSLMAHAQYRSVPWLVAVAAGYGVTLYYFHGSFLTVIQILGIFGLLMLGVCALFTWVLKGKAK